MAEEITFKLNVDTSDSSKKLKKTEKGFEDVDGSVK